MAEQVIEIDTLQCESSDEDCQETWKDLDSNRNYILTKGLQVETDFLGRPLKHFVPYHSGMTSGKKRNELLAQLRQKKKSQLYSRMVSSSKNESYKKLPTFYRPATKKLLGYAMFPRPIALPYCNSPKNNTKRIQRQSANEQNLTPYLESLREGNRNGIQACSFFTPTTGRRSPSDESSIEKTSHTKPSASPELTNRYKNPMRETLKNSLLKVKHLSFLKSTFDYKPSPDPKYDLEREEMLSGEKGEARQRKLRAFLNIKEDVRRQIEEIQGYKHTPEKIKPVSFKGVHAVKLPTESELHAVAKERRKKLNPLPFEMEEKNREIAQLTYMKSRRRNEQMKYKSKLSRTTALTPIY